MLLTAPCPQILTSAVFLGLTGKEWEQAGRARHEIVLCCHSVDISLMPPLEAQQGRSVPGAAGTHRGGGGREYQLLPCLLQQCSQPATTFASSLAPTNEGSTAGCCPSHPPQFSYWSPHFQMDPGRAGIAKPPDTETFYLFRVCPFPKAQNPSSRRRSKGSK